MPIIIVETAVVGSYWFETGCILWQFLLMIFLIFINNWFNLFAFFKRGIYVNFLNIIIVFVVVGAPEEAASLEPGYLQISLIFLFIHQIKCFFNYFLICSYWSFIGRMVSYNLFSHVEVVLGNIGLHRSLPPTRLFHHTLWMVSQGYFWSFWSIQSLIPNLIRCLMPNWRHHVKFIKWIAEIGVFLVLSFLRFLFKLNVQEIKLIH